MRWLSLTCWFLFWLQKWWQKVYEFTRLAVFVLVLLARIPGTRCHTRTLSIRNISDYLWVLVIDRAFGPPFSILSVAVVASCYLLNFVTWSNSSLSFIVLAKDFLLWTFYRVNSWLTIGEHWADIETRSCRLQRTAHFANNKTLEQLLTRLTFTRSIVARL